MATYEYHSTRPEEENYLIAYIDLLGTKEYIDKGESQKVFKAVYGTYSITTKLFAKMESFHFEDLVFKIFSDNILIAIKAETSTIEDAYKKMFQFLKILLNPLLIEGILFRGGITFNKLAIDDIIVWGKGLSEVVVLEEKVAIYPRVIISKSLANLLTEIVDEPENLEEKYGILQDIDGCHYLDYVIYEEPFSDHPIKNSYKHITEKSEKETNPRVLQKYNWHLNYLKYAREKYNEMWSEASFYIEW